MAVDIKTKLLELVNEIVDNMGGERVVKEWLSIDEVSVMTGTSDSYVRRAIKSGELPSANTGTAERPKYAVSRKDVNEWMESKKGVVSARTLAKLPPSPHYQKALGVLPEEGEVPSEPPVDDHPISSALNQS